MGAPSGSLAATGDTILRVFKTATETVNNSTTLQDDDELVLPVVADTIYRFRLLLRISGTTTEQGKFNVDLPAGGNVIFGGSHRQGGSYATFWTAGSAAIAFSAQPRLFGVVTNADQELHLFEGIMIIGGTGGNAQIQWAQYTAGLTDLSVLPGSFLELQAAT